MPRRLLTIKEAADAFAAKSAPDSVAIRTSAFMSGEEAGRRISFILSDESVARDLHTISTAGWELDNYRKNPVVLLSHDDSMPPIARTVEIGAIGSQLRATAEFPEADVYPLGDTIYRMLVGGFMNAASVGWLPLEWRAANDRKRPGGLDFTRQEMLEWSIVSVPALPTALVTARKAGVDTRPLYAWAERLLDLNDFAAVPRAELEALRKAAMPKPATKRASSSWSCTAARDLEIDDKTAWDGAEAEKRMLDAATHDGKIDVAEAGRGFLLHDGSGERGGFKEPFADLVDGKLKAIAGGVRAAAQRLPDVKDVPDSARKEAQAVIDAYHKKIADEVKEPERGFAALARKFHKRDLFSLASFCYFLAGIENLYDSVAEEAAREDDGSDLPAKLRAWIDDGNRILLEMAGEETAEQIAGTQDDKSGAYYWSAATLESALARALDARGLTRKGAKYSADTVRCLRAAHDHVKKAHEQLGDMLDDADNSDPETNADNPGDDPDDDDSRAARKAKADALKARIGARR